MVPSDVEQLLGILSSSTDPGVDRSEEGENAASLEADTVDEQPKSLSGTPDRQPVFTRRSSFIRKDSHPLALDLILFDMFGPEWLSWDPEVVWSEIKSELNVTPGVHTRNMINAVKTMHLVDTPWTEWEVFTVAATALTGEIPDFRILRRPTISQIIPAVDMMNQLKEREFSEEVARYIAACFLDRGVYYMPPPVDFAQVHASSPRYRCTKCGNIDTDEENEVCDSCGAPDKFLEKTLERDPAPVKERYDQVVKDGDSRNYWLMENAVDVQVAKLMVGKQYREDFSRRLADQLRAIKNG